MLGNLIGAFVVIMVGLSMYATINDTIKTIPMDNNATSAASTMMAATPVMFIILIIGVGILMAVHAMRSVGLFGGEEYYEETDETIEPIIEKPKKQTYMDYVKERLGAEKMLRRWRL